jgi:cobalt/nickel transport system permease protein
MGLLASATFAISMLHFPLGGTSVHLGLYGLTGILVGRRAFPVIVSTLAMQMFLFQHGGLLVMGVNAINLGSGALLAAWLWRRTAIPQWVRAFGCGVLGILAPALLIATEFQFAGYGKGFYVVALFYLGAAVLEGILTNVIVAFLGRTRPLLLAAPQ